MRGKQSLFSRWKRVRRTAFVLYLTLIVMVPVIHSGPLTWRVWLIFLGGPTAALILLAFWPEEE